TLPTGTPIWRNASPKALANALPLSLRLRWAAMLSGWNGSVSAWSGKVAPWRTTMTKPPARSALATSLSSAAAEIGAVSEIAANNPPANANAANLRREGTRMINLQLMREAFYQYTLRR